MQSSAALGLDDIGNMDHIPMVASVMTPFPYWIDVDESVRRARALMVEHTIRHLPVMRGGSLIGMLSDRDLKRALDPAIGLPPEDELFVRDVYISDPYVVDSRTALDVVLEHMAAHHIGSALVTSHGRLAGIFTASDACRLYCNHLRKLFPARSGEHVA